MFLTALRTLCEECDWIIKCGRTLEGYRRIYSPDGARILYNADINTLRTYAALVVVAGRRTRSAIGGMVADYTDIVLTSGEYTAQDIIDTFAGII
jgi:hypothetical protein